MGLLHASPRICTVLFTVSQKEWVSGIMFCFPFLSWSKEANAWLVLFLLLLGGKNLCRSLGKLQRVEELAQD